MMLMIFDHDVVVDCDHFVKLFPIYVTLAHKSNDNFLIITYSTTT